LCGIDREYVFLVEAGTAEIVTLPFQPRPHVCRVLVILPRYSRGIETAKDLGVDTAKNEVTVEVGFEQNKRYPSADEIALIGASNVLALYSSSHTVSLYISWRKFIGQA
jgi:hypothetical protein